MTVTQLLDDSLGIVPGGKPLLCFAPEGRPRVRTRLVTRRTGRLDLPHVRAKRSGAACGERPGGEPHRGEALSEYGPIAIAQKPIAGVFLAQPYRHPIGQMHEPPRFPTRPRTNRARRTTTRSPAIRTTRLGHIPPARPCLPAQIPDSGHTTHRARTTCYSAPPTCAICVTPLSHFM